MVATLVLLSNGPTLWRSETGLVPLVPRLVAACMWCAIYFGIDLLDDLHESEMVFVRSEAAAVAVENRALKAEAVSQQHELRQLQEQMNPHFLFNALNAVAAIKDDPEAVEQVTQDLSEYLRFALREARALEPLARELHAPEKYLAVQQRRFGENLVCGITADRDSTTNVGLGDTISVPLRGKGRTAFIPIGDICWIESLRNYTRVGLINPGRVLFFRRRLGEWEADLPTGLFERLGKSLVVQIALIQETEWKSRDETVLTFAADIEPLVIGRLAAMRLRDVFGEGSDGLV